jgi:hypothetical protein
MVGGVLGTAFRLCRGVGWRGGRVLLGCLALFGVSVGLWGRRWKRESWCVE